jgi:hypothetical protein
MRLHRRTPSGCSGQREIELNDCRLNHATGINGMDRFVNEQNIERFRRLAFAVNNEAERRMLFELLAAEAIEFKEQQKVRPERCHSEAVTKDSLAI